MTIKDFINEDDGANELIDELFNKYDEIAHKDDLTTRQWNYRRTIVRQIIKDWEAKRSN